MISTRHTGGGRVKSFSGREDMEARLMSPVRSGMTLYGGSCVPQHSCDKWELRDLWGEPLCSSSGWGLLLTSRYPQLIQKIASACPGFQHHYRTVISNSLYPTTPNPYTMLIQKCLLDCLQVRPMAHSTTVPRFSHPHSD